MKKKILCICVLVLLIILIYVCNISNIPNSIILLEGEKLKLNTLAGIKTVQVSSSIAESKNKKMNIQLNLLGGLTLKEIDVNVLPELKVVPVRKSYWIKVIHKWCVNCGNDRN